MNASAVCWRDCCLTLVLLLAGCGGGLKTGTVSGEITHDGKPLADAVVKFTPQSSGIESPGSSGKTDASGTYTLSVVSTGAVGAVVGRHRVSVIKVFDAGQGDDADAAVPDDKDALPPHDFTFEVKSGSNQADFDLKSP